MVSRHPTSPVSCDARTKEGGRRLPSEDLFTVPCVGSASGVDGAADSAAEILGKTEALSRQGRMLQLRQGPRATLYHWPLQLRESQD